jgi:hypothetical protein
VSVNFGTSIQEVPFGGGDDNKFNLGSNFPLNTEIGGSRKRMNVFRQILKKDHLG